MQQRRSARLATAFLGATAALLMLTPALAGDCEPHWDGAIGQPGMNDRVYALAEFDDGSGAGPALYAGGWFSVAGGVEANNIAKWDGQSWSALGSGVSCCYVYALTEFDDGSGVGPALYAGGDFMTAGGVAVDRLARWDGESWSPLGSGMEHNVIALTEFDDGSGPALYAGGWFWEAGEVSANYIAKWQGCPTNPECASADLNCDGVVDGADLLILLAAWGQCADPKDCPADLNNDGNVDGADLLILLSNWG